MQNKVCTARNMCCRYKANLCEECTHSWLEEKHWYEHWVYPQEYKSYRMEDIKRDRANEECFARARNEMQRNAEHWAKLRNKKNKK